MCGRLNVTDDPLTQLLMEAFGISAAPVTNHNTAPTEPVLAVRSGSGGAAQPAPAGAELIAKAPLTAAPFTAQALRWWLTPSWSKEMSTRYAMFNAKAETIAEKRSFARPFRSQRCVIPVTGYYEWQTGKREKLPFHIRAADNQGLLLAGLWDAWTNGATGERVESCTIVTTAAHTMLAGLHHRQPVFLSVPDALAWLDGTTPVDELLALTVPQLPSALLVDPVSSYVNNARNKDARVLQPIAPSLYVDGQGSELDAALSALPAEPAPETEERRGLDGSAHNPAGQDRPPIERDLFDV